MAEMEKIVEELKAVFLFKNTTAEGDIVLVVSEDPQMIVYARVGGIERDRSKKEEWWHVTLHFLTLPPQKTVWILREPQFTGQEIFTMGGKKKFIQAVDFVDSLPTPGKGEQPHQDADRKPSLRVVK